MNEIYKNILRITKALEGLLVELAHISARWHSSRAFFVFKR